MYRSIRTPIVEARSSLFGHLYGKVPRNSGFAPLWLASAFLGG